MKQNMLTLALIALATVAKAQPLEECQKAAERNYPLIRQYDLITKTTDLTVKNIQKGWLPQITVSTQITYQSDVMSWPGNMKGLFQQMGLDMKGLTKDQYKVGIDLQQTIYDGGAIGSQNKIARQQGKVKEAQHEVTLYQIRKRVNEMYFALLLLDEQIKLNDDIKALLMSSEKRLCNMMKSGTAAMSDLENVKAERLNAEQQNTSMKSQRNTLQRLLSIFCGIEVNNAQKPEIVKERSLSINRPELRLFDAQLQLTDVQGKALNAQLLPKLGLFAQGYYGYPGLNMFQDMIKHKWGLNGIVGVKLFWNIGALYTRKNDKAKLLLQREITENSREVFLFNTKLEQTQQNENISRYLNMIQSDNEIIALRTHVRKAAESKLAHGIIDVNSLLREINSENAAKIQQAIHEIDMLKEMYNQKNTNNE